MRRFVVTILAAGLSTAALAQTSPLTAPEEPAPFREVSVLKARRGTLDATLEVRYAFNQIGTDRVYLRSYNGALVGPTLEARPGDTLAVTFANRLPCLDPPCRCTAEPVAEHGGHGVGLTSIPDPKVFNTTNLHTHGLHVSPSGNSDNVLLKIEPGCSFPFVFRIPANHPAGTFWYHAHWHGSTAIQLANGMQGALIIRGPFDDVPGIRGARERLFVFQQIPYRCNPNNWECRPGDIGVVNDFNDLGFGKWNASGRFTTINGVAQPLIQLRPGEVQRWRFIHGGIRESIRVGVGPCPTGDAFTNLLYEIALDGLPTGEIASRATIPLQPGYRADVMFRAPQQTGEVCLIDYDSPAAEALLLEAEPRKVLAVIQVRDAPVSMPLPRNEDLRPFRLPSITDQEIAGRPRQTVTFNIDTTVTPNKFTVDGAEYPHGTTRVLELGKADEWIVASQRANHPFHIHVNPFEVIEKNPDGSVARRYFKDTLLVTPGQPVTLRSRYETFDGLFVLHCHILDHEDQGMMQNVAIVRREK